MTIRRFRIPRAFEARMLSLSVVFAGVAACSDTSGAGGPVEDARAPEAEAGQLDTGASDALAETQADTTGPDAPTDATGDAPSDAPFDVAMLDGSADAGLRACVQAVGEGGTIDLEYLDGGVVGTEVLFADGGAEVLLLDGGYGGTVVTNDAGMEWVEDAGPCDYFI
jgi:hypothetical protein